MSSAPWKHWQVKVREGDEWIIQVGSLPLPLFSASSLERYPDDLLIWTLSILINSSLWYGMIYGSPSSSPLRLPCLNTTSGKGSRFIWAVKVQLHLLVFVLINWWIVGRFSVWRILSRYGENGEIRSGEGPLSVQGFDHPGKVSDISLRGHDGRLHRPCSRLCQWKGWPFNWGRR